MTLTYSHTFPGDTGVTKFQLKYTSDGKTPEDFAFQLTATKPDGTAMTDTEAQGELVRAMSEQGRIDLGYGDIRDYSTLLDDLYRRPECINRTQLRRGTVTG